MRSAIVIYILFALVFTTMLVKCHNELAFLKNDLIIPEYNNLASIPHEKAEAAVPDYDMYVLSIQWGSKKN